MGAESLFTLVWANIKKTAYHEAVASVRGGKLNYFKVLICSH